MTKGQGHTLDAVSSLETDSAVQKDGLSLVSVFLFPDQSFNQSLLQPLSWVASSLDTHAGNEAQTATRQRRGGGSEREGVADGWVQGWDPHTLWPGLLAAMVF